jgi:hypothetical protein
VGAAIYVGDMKMFSVAYVSGLNAKQLLHVVNCDACKAFLTSQVMLSTIVFIYFKKYHDTVQSPTYWSEKVIEAVGTCVTLLDNMMAGVADLSLVNKHFTAAIENNVDFESGPLVVHFTTK